MNKYVTILPFTILTMEHEYYGKYTLSLSEFKVIFSLSTKGIQNLILGKIKNYNGWRLVNATDIKD